MHDFSGTDVLAPMHSLLLSFTVRPEEIEMAFATNGESLRHRLLLALIAELAIADPHHVAP